MAGHSHWAGIKHQKEIADKKRARVFSKLLTAISAAAKTEPNPDFNPRLRTAIQKAKAEKVPAENIERAIRKATEVAGDLEELVFEAYGPGGTAVIATAITTSRNRTVAEVKKVIADAGGKWAETGSVAWAFASTIEGGETVWRAKFPQSLSSEDAAALRELVGALQGHDDIQAVYTNAPASF